MSVQRLAGIDIGTLTCRLLIADLPSSGPLTELHSERRILRLGEGVDQSKQLKRDAMDRVMECLRDWRAVIDTNLNGTWYMMQSAARQWRDHGSPGNIVNIVANVWRGMPQVAHTCAARAGVIYLSKTVATEWAPLRIRVNCISPGSIATEGLNVYPEEVADNFRKSNPMREVGDVYDIAQGVVYLAADTGKFITGEVLVIDGGNSQWGDVWPGGKPEYFKVDES